MAAAGGGLFVAFEGGEASGKSTQARLLARSLESLGYRVVRTAEPGGTPLGLRVRRLVKYGRVEIEPLAEAMLFLAARAQLVRRVVEPALARGEAVVCDRFADSTLAYQGYGRGLDVGLLRRLNDLATGGLRPALTVLLDLPVEAAMGRRSPRGGDRFDVEMAPGAGSGGFHQRVRDGFLSLAGEEPDRWLVVDAAIPRRDVARLVLERLGLGAPGG